MARGDPPQSPFVYESSDYQDNVIRITVSWDNTTRALLNAVVFRDSACVYRKVYVGLGDDGTPDTTPHVFTVPAGTRTITAAQLANNGLNTAEDVLALQVTAGP